MVRVIGSSHRVGGRHHRMPRPQVALLSRMRQSTPSPRGAPGGACAMGSRGAAMLDRRRHRCHDAAPPARGRMPPMKSRYSIFSLARNALTHHRDWSAAWRSPEPRPAYDVIIVGGGGHGLATAYYL